MSLKVKQSKINIRSELSKTSPEFSDFIERWFLFGDAFEVPSNEEIFQVFHGDLMREGTIEDYVISDDGFIKTIVFAVAPTILDVAVFTRRKL